METLKINYQNDYAVVCLDRGKGNPINITMMEEIMECFKQLAENEQVRGVVLTGKPPIFSVGLDIKELLSLDAEGTGKFFATFRSMIFDLVKFPKPMVAAVTGHSPAGGCILAICADYRIMSEGLYQIGLNEVPVGIMVTPAIFELYSFWIGRRRAYQNFLEGKLMTPQEAENYGLIDQVVPMEIVLSTAENKLQQLLMADQTTLVGVKNNIRLPLIANMEKWKKMPQVNPVEHFLKPTSRAVLMNVLKSLANKK